MLARRGWLGTCVLSILVLFFLFAKRALGDATLGTHASMGAHVTLP